MVGRGAAGRPERARAGHARWSEGASEGARGSESFPTRSERFSSEVAAPSLTLTLSPSRDVGKCEHCEHHSTITGLRKRGREETAREGVGKGRGVKTRVGSEQLWPLQSSWVAISLDVLLHRLRRRRPDRRPLAVSASHARERGRGRAAGALSFLFSFDSKNIDVPRSRSNLLSLNTTSGMG